MLKLDTLYARLPVMLQNVACTIEGWRLQQLRFTKEFPRLLQEAESRTYWSKEQIQAYSDQRLGAFVKHCATTVPYYRRLFCELGITPEQIQTRADLQQLPILSKEEVKRNFADLISEAIPKKQRILVSTSGTTGSGLRFVTTQRALQEQWTMPWRFRRWHGVQMDTWCAFFAGRPVVPLAQTEPPFWRYNYPGHQILFSGYHMSPHNLRAYVRELRARKPPYFQGYPSLLALLATHLLETGGTLDYEVKWVITNSENLLPHQADLITQAFGVRPIQQYGMAEAIASASECEYGRLHVDEDAAATEFIPDDDGIGYKVVGTGFTNWAFPFLRYQVGDVVSLTDDSCSCGRPGRILTSIDGRQEDYVVLKNGTRLGRVSRIVKNMVNIREAQIYQNKVGEITIRVVRGEHYTANDEAALIHEARQRVGDGAEILIEYVPKLERSRTGKLRFVVSDIPEGQLAKFAIHR